MLKERKNELGIELWLRNVCFSGRILLPVSSFSSILGFVSSHCILHHSYYIVEKKVLKLYFTSKVVKRPNYVVDSPKTRILGESRTIMRPEYHHRNIAAAVQSVTRVESRRRQGIHENLSRWCAI